MTLLMHELESTLETYVTTDAKVHQVYAVRPHVYRKGAPAGTVKMQILTVGGDLVAESATQAIADIGTGTHWHGYAQFSVAAQLAPSTRYKVKMTSAGYSFHANNFMAWINALDLAKYTSPAPAAGPNAPLDVEVWSRQRAKKGVA